MMMTNCEVAIEGSCVLRVRTFSCRLLLQKGDTRLELAVVQWLGTYLAFR